MRILFLGLTGDGALENNAIKALEHRFNAAEDRINDIRVFAVAPSIKETGSFENNFDIDFEQYDKIIIASHGMPEDTRYCYKDEFDKHSTSPAEDRLLSAEQLAKFLVGLDTSSSFLSNRKICVELCICYAARSSQYTANHDAIDIHALQDSFAYQFTHQLNTILNGLPEIEVTAYLGAMTYEKQTGMPTCQTEESVLDQLNADAKLDEKNQLSTLINGKIQALEQMLKKMSRDIEDASTYFPEEVAEIERLQEQEVSLLNHYVPRRTEILQANTGAVIFESTRFSKEISIRRQMKESDLQNKEITTPVMADACCVLFNKP